MVMLKRQYWLAAGWLLSASACVSARAPQPPQRPDTGPAQPAPEVPAVLRKGQWSIRYSEQNVSYHVTRHALIQSSDSTLQQENSTNVTHESLSLTFAAGDSISFKVSAIADTFVTSNQGRIGTAATTQLPIQIDGVLSSTGLTIPTTERDTICNPAASIVVADLHSLLPPFPSTLSSGLRWQDSTQIQGCQGGITATSKSVRSFEVLGEVTFRGRQAIQIEAADSTTAEGQGLQQQHQITMTAAGAGHATYFIDATMGRVLHLRRVQTLNISIRAEGRNSPFVQTVEQEFDAEP